MCRQTRWILAIHEAHCQEIVDADAHPLGADEAVALAERADRLSVTRAGSLHTFDLGERAPTRRQLLEVMLAPSGHLRAPTLLIGDHLLIGHDRNALTAALMRHGR